MWKNTILRHQRRVFEKIGVIKPNVSTKATDQLVSVRGLKIREKAFSHETSDKDKAIILSHSFLEDIGSENMKWVLEQQFEENTSFRAFFSALTLLRNSLIVKDQYTAYSAFSQQNEDLISDWVTLNINKFKGACHDRETMMKALAVFSFLSESKLMNQDDFDTLTSILMESEYTV